MKSQPERSLDSKHCGNAGESMLFMERADCWPAVASCDRLQHCWRHESSGCPRVRLDWHGVREHYHDGEKRLEVKTWGGKEPLGAAGSFSRRLGAGSGSPWRCQRAALDPGAWSNPPPWRPTPSRPARTGTHGRKILHKTLHTQSWHHYSHVLLIRGGRWNRGCVLLPSQQLGQDYNTIAYYVSETSHCK